MTHRIVLHDRARRDIVHSFRWIESQSQSRKSAEAWYAGILEAIRSLGINPERCEVAPESGDLPITLRHLLYGHRQHKHRIIFSVRPNRIHIWTIRHAARNKLKFEDLLS